MTTTYQTQTIPYKKDLPISVWLFMQGYHASFLPTRVTWYSLDREFSGRTDHYTLNLYRGMGYVLDKRFLDQGMWNTQVTHLHGESNVATKPCSIVIAPPKVPNTVPRLARELIGLLDDRDSWEGTASELLSLIGDRGDGIPQIHNRLSAELLQPYITDALDAYGITIQRERTSERRMLRLSLHDGGVSDRLRHIKKAVKLGYNGERFLMAQFKLISLLLLIVALTVMVGCGGVGQARETSFPTSTHKLTGTTPYVEKKDEAVVHYALRSPWDTHAFKNGIELPPGQCPQPTGLPTQIPDRLENGAVNEAAWSNIGSDIVIPLSDQAISEGSQAAAICVLDYLYFWARNNAFVIDRECNADGPHWEHGYDRSNFITGTLAIPYLQIRNASVLDETKRSVVLSWFERLHMCNKTRAKGMLLDAQENGLGPHNQTYSALLAVAATSIALGKGGEFNWAIEGYRQSIATISAEGTAPNAVAHKMEWTQHYHTLIENFSVHLSLLGEINGVEGLFEDPALIRLTNLVVDSYFGSTYLEELTGFEQTQNPLTTPWNLSWLEHLKRYNEDPRVTQLAAQFQWQMDHFHTGGHPEYWWPEHMKSNT